MVGERCGDAIKNGKEECDDGLNDGGYGACAPGCVIGARCGDGVTQSDKEECDDGTNDGGYGECFAGCRLGDRCGDGKIQAPEQCDDGNTTSNDGCSAGCKSEAPK